MIKTKYTIQIIEKDVTGYYYPVYRTNVVVIANNPEEAKKTALERTSPRTHSSGYERFAKVITFEDIVVGVDSEVEE